MHVITTTQLRTQTTRLVKALEAGEDVTLIHRSKILGKIVVDTKTNDETVNPTPKKVFDPKRFAKLVEELNLPPTTHAERDAIYRQHLEEKYGKPVSGR